MSNRNALVCGASRGLGFAIAKELAQEGAHVIICSSNQERIHSAADELGNSTGKEITAFKCNLNEKSDIDNMVDRIMDRFNCIDILVNNTGGPPPGYFMEFDVDDWTNAFNNTFVSAIYLTRQLLPRMEKNSWGRIINLTSITVKQPVDNLLLSNSIRMAIIGWAKTISNQYAKQGITVNNIATGYTLTERVHNLAKSIADDSGITAEQAMQKWIENIPAGRLAQPEEIAATVAFLASERASYITGATIPVDGGFIQSMF
ncbi:SDR family oxidoreductase [candidate division KSB1 bacterium]|nr:SDR family oxidoreductase [candidate division KSB1 bacterium]